MDIGQFFGPQLHVGQKRMTPTYSHKTEQAWSLKVKFIKNTFDTSYN